MKYKYLPIIILAFTLFLGSCQQNDTSEDQMEEEVSPKPPLPESIEAAFTCRSISDDEANPKYEVSIEVDGIPRVLDTIPVCNMIPAEEYAQYDIPPAAVSACGGWWAGAGDYFYAVVSGHICTVIQGWSDEQQEDEGFHYSEIRTIEVFGVN
jgi:hypothetical protein